MNRPTKTAAASTSPAMTASAQRRDVLIRSNATYLVDPGATRAQLEDDLGHTLAAMNDLASLSLAHGPERVFDALRLLVGQASGMFEAMTARRDDERIESVSPGTAASAKAPTAAPAAILDRETFWRMSGLYVIAPETTQQDMADDMACLLGTAAALSEFTNRAYFAGVEMDPQAGYAVEYLTEQANGLCSAMRLRGSLSDEPARGRA